MSGLCRVSVSILLCGRSAHHAPPPLELHGQSGSIGHAPLQLKVMLLRVCAYILLAASAVACSFPNYAFEESALSSTCEDARIDNGETGLDCGGLCPPCNAGQGCVGATDCASTVCTMGICQEASCHDLVQNGDETAVDCGGVCETKCAVGQTCQSPYDCVTSACAGTCQPASCTDGVHNGDESAVDCGGSCDPCADGQSCLKSSDCRSTSCFHDICVSAGCTDKVMDGDETGVDCGGSCAPCASDASCVAGSDCVSLVCDPQIHACVPANCSDGVKNGNESDVDCGSGCTGCATGKRCASGSDCASALCKDGQCVPATASGAELSRAGWTVAASSADVNCQPSFAIDGDLQTRWSSGQYQMPGIWFKLDMQQPQLFFSVVLDARNEATDAPVLFDVYLSNDDNMFTTPTLVGQRGSALTTIDFGSAQLARYVYFELQGSSPTHWWSIDELNVFQ
jgi:hypothetical protein